MNGIDFQVSVDVIIHEKVSIGLLRDLERLGEAISYEDMRYGEILGFLPSGDLLYSTNQATFVLEHKTRISRKVTGQVFSTEALRNGSLVIISDELAIYGHGNSWGEPVESVNRLHLKTGEPSKKT